MIVDALIPVKGSVLGKERLARLLTADERTELVRAMVADVVAAVQLSAIRRVAVVSADPTMLAFVNERGAFPIAEPPGTRGLNGALAHGLAVLAEGGAGAALIVQGDVPLIDPDEIKALIAPAGVPIVRAAPTDDGGTSALLLAPPSALAPAFGTHSFARHRQASVAAGLPFERVEVPSLRWDVDRPEDVARLLNGVGTERTRAALVAMRVAERLIAAGIGEGRR